MMIGYRTQSTENPPYTRRKCLLSLFAGSCSLLACLVIGTTPTFAIDKGGISNMLIYDIERLTSRVIVAPGPVIDRAAIKARIMRLEKLIEHAVADRIRLYGKLAGSQWAYGESANETYVIADQLRVLDSQIREAKQNNEPAEEIEHLEAVRKATEERWTSSSKKTAKTASEVAAINKAISARGNEIKNLNNEINRLTEKMNSSGDVATLQPNSFWSAARTSSMSRPQRTSAFGMVESDGITYPVDLFGALHGHLFENDDFVDRDGKAVALSAGARVRLNENLSAGAVFNYTDADARSNLLNSDLDLEAFGVGLFANIGLPSGVALDLAAGYSHGNAGVTFGLSALNPIPATGAFDTDAFGATARLSRKFWPGPQWWIEPQVTVSYMNLRRGAFTDSIGLFQPVSTLEHGRLATGTRIGYEFMGSADDDVSPIIEYGRAYLDFSGVYDFVREDQILVAVGQTNLFAGTDNAGVKFGLGTDVVLRNGATFKLSADYSWLGDYGALDASARLTVPFN